MVIGNQAADAMREARETIQKISKQRDELLELTTRAVKLVEEVYGAKGGVGEGFKGLVGGKVEVGQH